MWLSTHMIPLFALSTYFTAFYPRASPHLSLALKNRLSGQHSASGSLRLWIRISELTDMDIVKLLKHTIRFPNSTVSVHALPDVDAAMLSSIHDLVANKADRWVNAIKGNKISGVLLNANHGQQICRIVVKEKYALPWMKAALGTHESAPVGFLEGLGLLEVVKFWRIDFGVDYS
jgi:hypothetical protein